MRRGGCKFGLIGVAAVLASAASRAVFAGPAATVTTAGSGELTICRDWLVYDTCDTYHHVALPKRVAVGDHIKLVFGRSDKEYDFYVTGIDRRGHRCAIMSPHTGANDSGEKIIVEQCAAAATPAAAR
ncbi:MAG TPA: hypothetical protein VME41_10180 [Stellaceae bacterium]|nr:hypothetical protein [Stellaceae bacterium]